MTPTQKLALSILLPEANADALKPDPAPVAQDGALQIAVLDRGFVYVGRIYRTPEGIRIEDARNVRRWGTENGLGQLATEGPQLNTRLDPCPPVHVPTHAIIHLIDCEASKWQSR